MKPNSCTFIPNNMELRTLLEAKGSEIIKGFSELVGYVRFPGKGLVKVFYKDKYGCSDTAVVPFGVISEKKRSN